MTATTDTDTTENEARVLSPRTRAAYGSDWALFTDHCAATDTAALPAAPDTVVGFRTACPAAPATGAAGAHRELPVDIEDAPAVAVPEKEPAKETTGGGYGPAEVAAALDRRGRDLQQLAGITDVLIDVEQRADEMNRRAAELLEQSGL